MHLLSLIFHSVSSDMNKDLQPNYLHLYCISFAASQLVAIASIYSMQSMGVWSGCLGACPYKKPTEIESNNNFD